MIAAHAKDLFGALIVSGAMAHLMIQVILNIAVVTNAIPNTGITLPFVSYGGTSIVFLLAEMGLVLNVSTMVEKKRKKLLGGRQMERERNARRRKNAKKRNMRRESTHWLF